jgi:hypothetical protein
VRRLELLVSMACYFAGTEGNIITYFGDERANFIVASNVKESKKNIESKKTFVALP